MRYLIIATRFAPLAGGVESYTQNLAATLAAKGDSAIVATMNISGAPSHELRDDGVEVLRFPCLSLLDGRFAAPRKCREYEAMMRMMEVAGADRILVNNRFYPFSLEGLKLASRMGLRAIVLDHGSMHLTLGSALPDRAIQCYEHRMTEKVQAYRPAFAGVSRKSAEWLGHFGIGTDLVLQNAIDAPRFRALSSGRDFRGEFGIPAGDTLVAFVGRMAPEKGPDKLVAAAQMLADVPLSFVFAGDGPMRKQLESRNTPNVHFAGNLGKPDLSSLLQESDLFCLPTRSEGFCTSLLEASACGTAALITDVGGARELIPDDTCGVIAAEADAETLAGALRGLAAGGNAALREMGDNARRVVEGDHGWDKTVEELERAFERLERMDAR